MKTIKQIKENRTGKSILDGMKPGDVMRDKLIMFIKTDKGTVVSEYGTEYEGDEAETMAEIVRDDRHGAIFIRELGDLFWLTAVMAERRGNERF